MIPVGITLGAIGLSKIFQQAMRKKRHLKGGFPKLHQNWDIQSHRSAFLAKKAYEHKGGHRHFGNFIHRKHFSDDRIIVHSTHKGNLHISIRGSDFLSPSRAFFDLANDALIATGTERLSPEFARVKNQVNKIIDYHKYKYGLSQRTTISGHSLGGSIVAHIMEDPSIRDKIHAAHAFNMGTGINLLDTQHPSHLHIHHNKGDLVNAMTRGTTGATWHYHDDHSFGPLSSHWNDDWEKLSYWRDTFNPADSSSTGETVEIST